MASSSKAEELIAKASQWTFEDDNSLLLWMEEIAKNLEQHVTTTNEKFNQLTANLNSTSIALDNATNSLSALQYTHFVENRCLDDDETIANVAEVPIPKSNQNDQPEEMTTEDFQRIFLKKNLDIWRNNYEKCPINSQYSKEENPTNNFIYKPKNPYNQSPLPHIIGTKLWKEQWHVGLLEDSNSSSNDKTSKGCSDTFSSRTEDKESLSQQDKHYVQIKNASSLSPESSAVSRGVAASSDTTAAKASVKQNEIRYDLFAPLQDTPPPMSFPSSPAAPPQPPPPPPPPQNQPFPSSIPTNTRPSPGEITKPPKATTSNSGSRPNKVVDDDVFSSLLSELLEKTNNTNKRTVTGAAARSNAPTASSTKITTIRKDTVKPPINLFDDSDNNTMACAPKSPEVAPEVNEPSTSKSNKPPTLNLFDNSDSSPPKDDLFATVDALFNDSRKTQPLRGHQINTKNIFDDDEDDDDDFLNIFTAKKKNIPKPFSKTLSFDDDERETGNKDYNDHDEKRISNTEDIQEVDKSRSLSEDGDWKTSKKISLPKIDLFGDLIEEENIFEQQQKVHNRQEQPTSVDQNVLAAKTQVKITSDIIIGEDKDDDDLFQSLNKRVEHGSLSSRINKPLTGYDDSDDDLFTSKQHDKKANEQNIEQKTDELLDDIINKGKEIQDSNLKETHSNSQHIESSSQQLFNTETKQISPPSDIINSHLIFQADARNDENSIASCSTNDKITNLNPNVTLSDVISNNSENSDLPSAAENVKSNMFESIVEKSNFNKYSSLFLEDEPPEDDDAFFQTLDSNAIAKSMTHDVEQEFYQSVQPTTDSGAFAASGLYASSGYGNLGLYSEIPPEDDDENFEQNVISSTSSQSNEPKRSLFYDDFDETMAAVNTQKTFESTRIVHGIFDDEPPLDDFQALLQDTTKNEHTADNFGDEKVKIPSSHENLPNILGPQTVVETKKPATVHESSTVKSFKNTEISMLDISKLPNINVKALLPTAVAPKQQQPTAETEPTKEQTVTSQEDVSLIRDSNSNDHPFNKTSTKSNDNLLVNVCKNRVRASSNRRPSTRRARQENYRKSLLSKQTEELATKLKQETGREHIEGEPLEEAQKPAAEFKRSEISKSMLEQKNNACDKTASPVKKPDFDENDHADQRSTFVDNFSVKKSESISFLSTNREPTVKTFSGSLFDDSDGDDDLFSPNNYKTNSPNTFISSEATVTATATAVVTKSIVSEADSKKYKNPSHENPSKKLPFDHSNLFSKSKESESKKASSNLFSDDDDDDDDLFGGSLTNRTKSSIPASSTISEATIVSTTAATSDLFANNKTSKTENIHQSKLFTSTKVKSLFESDEDEGDDGDAFLKTTQQQATQKFSSLQKIPAKVLDKTHLFSDTDDEDDDLFSSRSPKGTRGTVSSANVIVSQTSKPPARKTTTTKSTTTNPDNPLADLLNN